MDRTPDEGRRANLTSASRQDVRAEHDRSVVDEGIDEADQAVVADEVDEVDEASDESFPASDAPQWWQGPNPT